MTFPMSRSTTPGFMIFMALSSASLLASMSLVWLLVPISSVHAVSATFPLTCTPMSNLTTSPFVKVSGSLIRGVKCAASPLSDRQVGNAGCAPSSRILFSTVSAMSNSFSPSLNRLFPHSRTFFAMRPASMWSSNVTMCFCPCSLLLIFL